MTLCSFTQPADGTVKLDPSGNLVYTPNISFTGSDTFSYSVTDGTYHLGKHSTHYKQRFFAVNHENSGLYGVRNIVAGVIFSEFDSY